MPQYEYECKNCAKVTSVIVSYKLRPDNILCVCDHKATRRISLPGKYLQSVVEYDPQLDFTGTSKERDAKAAEMGMIPTTKYDNQQALSRTVKTLDEHKRVDRAFKAELDTHGDRNKAYINLLRS